MKMTLFQPMERRQEVALIGALFFVGLVAVQGWVMGPHLAALKAAQQYESAIDAYKDKGKNVNSKLRAKRMWLDKLIAKRGLLSDMVFTPAKAEEFLSDLQAFCTETGCAMGSVRHLGEQGQDTSTIVARTTSLTVQGAYNDITQLIQKLTSRSQKVCIESLQMAAVRLDPGQVVCRLVISIYVNLDKESGTNETAQMSQ